MKKLYMYAWMLLVSVVSFSSEKSPTPGEQTVAEEDMVPNIATHYTQQGNTVVVHFSSGHVLSCSVSGFQKTGYGHLPRLEQTEAKKSTK